MSKLDIAKAIFNKNLSMMEEADIIIANVDNFRGFCIDDGTAFECGYFYSSGKPCYGYLHSFGKTYKDKMTGLYYIDEEGKAKDFNGYFVEDLNLMCNLMISMSLDGIYKTLEEVLIRLKEYY
jgi:nucleoside 2-deoxyribosyltransferase